jgi:hypothetical protein
MGNDHGKAGGVRGEEHFGGTGLKVGGGGGGVSRASREGLMGMRISGLPKIGATGRKRSLGKSLREVRKLRGEVERTTLYLKGGSKLSSKGRAQQALSRHKGVPTPPLLGYGWLTILQRFVLEGDLSPNEDVDRKEGICHDPTL